jgi:hypothetical protein
MDIKKFFWKFDIAKIKRYYLFNILQLLRLIKKIIFCFKLDAIKLLNLFYHYIFT